MKRTISTFILICSVLIGLGQTNLNFCVEANKDGKCKNQGSEFTISKDGGTITFMLKNEQGLGTSQILYKIFKLNDDGKETFNATLEQAVQVKWNYAWEEAVFYDPGTYKVMVYDKLKDGNLISVGILKIFTQ